MTTRRIITRIELPDGLSYDSFCAELNKAVNLGSEKILFIGYINITPKNRIQYRILIDTASGFMNVQYEVPNLGTFVIGWSIYLAVFTAWYYAHCKTSCLYEALQLFDERTDPPNKQIFSGSINLGE